MNISIIGAGRAGGSLGIYFKNKGFKISGYYSKTFVHAKKASENVGAAPHLKLGDVTCSDIIIIAVPDDKIKSVSDELGKFDLSQKHVLHLSGAHTSCVLSSCKAAGAKTYSLHPPYSFGTKTQAPQDITFALEGEDILEFCKILDKHSIKYVILDKSKKPLYHAAAVMASNYVFSLLETSFEMLKECGFSQHEAQKYFSSLINVAVSNTIEKGREALTGPIARGDINTIKMHLEAIQDEETKALYKTLGNITLKFANLSGDVREKIRLILK